MSQKPIIKAIIHQKQGIIAHPGDREKGIPCTPGQNLHGATVVISLDKNAEREYNFFIKLNSSRVENFSHDSGKNLPRFKEGLRCQKN
jgi:hypothetical protein